MKEGKNEKEILSVIVGMFTVTTDTDGELSRIVHTRSARYYETATPGHPMLTLAECRSAMLQY